MALFHIGCTNCVVGWFLVFSYFEFPDWKWSKIFNKFSWERLNVKIVEVRKAEGAGGLFWEQYRERWSVAGIGSDICILLNETILSMLRRTYWRVIVVAGSHLLLHKLYIHSLMPSFSRQSEHWLKMLTTYTRAH